MINKILVLGLGSIGEAVGTFLHHSGFDVVGIDKDTKYLDFITVNAHFDDFAGSLYDCDAVVSCLPFLYNAFIAESCVYHNIHYFDLTEDRETVNTILKLTAEKSVLMPGCGLAPGLVNIIGADMLKKRHCDSLEMHCGALPQKGGYACNWSVDGLINEYTNPCDVIDSHYGHTQVDALGWLEDVVVDGIELEAFNTSGGVGTMCDTYDGKIQELRYRSLRYRGHARMVSELLCMSDTPAEHKFPRLFPPTDDDMVIVNLEGVFDKDTDTYTRLFYPLELHGTQYKAISWVTASSVCAVVEMVSKGSLPQHGFIKQESIPLNEFYNTENGGRLK